MALSAKRAEYLAGASLALSILFFIICLLLGLWSGYFAVFAVSWLALCCAFVWFALLLQFHHRSLAEQEKLDAARAEKQRQATVFEGRPEQQELLVAARRRLEVFEKWFLPIFSVALAAYQFAMGFYLLRHAEAWAQLQTKEPLLCAVLMTAIAFVSFLISRYATGMSSQMQWKPLRAGGSFLLCTAVLCFAMGLALAGAQFKFFVALNVLGHVIAWLLIVLGAETALNVVLDAYRPRVKGEYARAAFDSRLLGLISEPGGIFRTAAAAIDYQFGFKVSQTWFYKLLEKAIVPLVLFGCITMYLLSGIVVIRPNEQAIIERFGNPFDDGGRLRYAGPGLHFKWPWPIDIAYRYPTRSISQISVGFVAKPEAEKGGYGPLLWGKTHYEKEYKLLVASESEGRGPETVPVSLVMAAVPVQYRVKDLYHFLYNHGVSTGRDGTRIYQAEERLKAICYEELTKFAASAKLEATDSAQNDSLLGAGRDVAKHELTRRIQAAADKAGLGVEIVFVGLQGIHPPPEVASDYQKVIGAIQKKQASILDAEAYRVETLSKLAGSVEQAGKVYALAAAYHRAKEHQDSESLSRLAAELDRAFADAQGDIFSQLRSAQSYAHQKATLSRAAGMRFAGQVRAYQAAGRIYKHHLRASGLEKGLADARKFVVVVDQNDTEVTIVDLQEKLTPSLYDLSGGAIQESKEK